MHESGGALWVPVHVKDGVVCEYWDLVDLTLKKRLLILTRLADKGREATPRRNQ